MLQKIHESTNHSRCYRITSTWWYMAKVDLMWAYRFVGTRKAHHTLAGLKWTFRGDSQPTYLCDQRLSFGSRKSTSAFNRITQTVRHLLADKGIPCTSYLYDFFLCGHDFDSSQNALNTLIQLLRSLGFRINWKKFVDPTQRLVFLGIQLDTVLVMIHEIVFLAL